MKKKLFVLLVALHGLIVMAQTTVINVTTAGGLGTALSNAGHDANSVSNLKVTGTIDARDIFYMRDNMPVLAILDLEESQIQAYITYPANEMPEESFHYSSLFKGKTSLTNIKFPASLSSIGSEAFMYCDGLSGDLILPESVHIVRDYAFWGCYYITDLIMPGVHSIGIGSFASCYGLTGILVLPGSLNFIGERAFNWCKELEGVTIPSSVTSIAIQAFSICRKLSSINVDGDNAYYSDIDGVLFNKNKNKLVEYPIGKEIQTYNIPGSVDSIGDFALYYSEKLTHLTLSSSLTFIGEWAFAGCSNLTGSLTIPGSVTSIGYYSFYNCSGLTGNLFIPGSVTSIGISAFKDCSGFTGLTISSSVTSIGDDAFYNCNNLKRIIVQNTTPLSIGSETFYNVNKETSQLAVPIGSITEYQEADYWNEFNIIIEGLVVHYDLNGGNGIIDTIVNMSTKIITPTIPTKAGSIFAGWYKEDLYTNTWDFANDVVTTNTTLYAKWTVLVNYIDIENSPSLSMFPNPAADFVKIEGEKLQTVFICDLLGKIQLQENLSGEESAFVNVTSLKSGCYIVISKTFDGRENMFKLIKN